MLVDEVGGGLEQDRCIVCHNPSHSGEVEVLDQHVAKMEFLCYVILILGLDALGKKCPNEDSALASGGHDIHNRLLPP